MLQREWISIGVYSYSISTLAFNKFTIRISIVRPFNFIMQGSFVAEAASQLDYITS